MRTLNFKKALLAGTAIVAVGAFATGAHATDSELAGTTAAPTDLLTVPDAFASGTDSIVNAAATNNDAGEIDANGGVTVVSINSDVNGTIGIHDGTAGGDDLTVSTFADIASATTLNFVLGGSELDGTGTNGNVDVIITTTLGEAGASTLTRGGTANIVGVTNQDSASTFTVNGNTLLTNVDVTGGAAGTADGQDVTATFGDASSDTFDVTTLDVTAGNGSGSTDGEVGGDATAVITATATLGGATTVTGGDDAAGAGGGANGGNAVLTFTNGVTSTSTLAVSTGTAAAAGTNGSATVNFGGDATFTAITLEEGDSGTATLNFNGSSAQTITGTIDGATGANEGVITITGDGGVTFASAIGATRDIESVTLSNDGTGNSVTFQAAVGVDNASGIVLGDGGGTADAYTATFDTSVAGFTVDGTVIGAATDTATVNVTGGNTLVQSDAWGGTVIEALNVTGTGTKLDQGAQIDATNITVGSGATLEVNAAINGAIDGAGTLDVDTGATITGAIGQTTQVGAVDIAAVTLVQGSAAGYSVATTTFSGNGQLTISDGNQTVAGNFTNATDGEGTIVVDNGAGTTAFTGNLGASTDNSLAALNIGGAAGQTVTTTGNLYVDAITTNNAADTIQFLGATGTTQVVSGTINDNGGNNEGIIRVGNDTLAPTVQFDGTIGNAQRLNTLEVNEGSTAFLNAAASFDTAVTVDTGSTLRIGSGDTLTVQAAGTITNNGTIQIDVEDTNGTLAATDFGQIATANEALDTDGVTINVTGFIGTADDLDPFGALTFDEAKALTDNSALYTFTIDALHQVDVTQESAASFTDTASNSNVATELMSLGATATGDLATVADTFAAADSSTVNDVLEATTSVNSNAGGVAAGVTVGNQTASLNSARLASLRDGSAVTGMAAGNGAQGLKVWGQAFGTTGEQDERDNVSGYDVDGYGVAVGVDTENLAENAVVGLAFSYADTEVESEGLANAKTEIDSYQIALYGDYDLDERTYLSGQVSYMWSDNDTTRNPGGVSSLTANGDYDASQWGVRAELARDYMADGGLTITPSALVNYVHYDADGYTETGAGGASLIVGDADVDVFEIGVGVDAAWKVENNDGSYLKPVLSAGVRHDLIGDEYATTNTFTGGGAAFNVEGFDPAQTTFDVGAGVTYFSTGGWDLSAEYDYEFKSDYDAHSGLVKASYSF